MNFISHLKTKYCYCLVPQKGYRFQTPAIFSFPILLYLSNFCQVLDAIWGRLDTPSCVESHHGFFTFYHALCILPLLSTFYRLLRRNRQGAMAHLTVCEFTQGQPAWNDSSPLTYRTDPFPLHCQDPHKTVILQEVPMQVLLTISMRG